MPYLFETKKMLIPREKKRNVKLSFEDRNEIARLYKTGEYSQRQLAEMFGVSRKLIYLYADDTGERLNKSMSDSRIRNKKYGSRNNAEYVKQTRMYKKKLYEEGKLEGGYHGEKDKK